MEEYYRKNYQLSDFKYIRKENIDSGSMNITSPDMFKEVDEYNYHVRRMIRKRDIIRLFAENSG